MGDSGNSAASQSSGGDQGGFAPASANEGTSMTGISGYASESPHIGSNAFGDFGRAPSGPSMSERPGYAPVTTNISSNANGDFGRVPHGSSMNDRPGYAPVTTNIRSNASGDFGRVPQGSSMNERPGYAPVNTNISSNANGDFGRVPLGSTMIERPGYTPANPNIITNAHGDFGRVPQRPNSSNVPAMTTNDWSHNQQPTIGNQYRPPHVPIQPDGPKPFQIFVKSFTDNKSHIFEVRTSDTVGKLKDMIEKRLDVAKSQQRLMYQSRPLDDDKKMSYYDIHERSTLDLTGGRLRGG